MSQNRLFLLILQEPNTTPFPYADAVKSTKQKKCSDVTDENEIRLLLMIL